MAEVTGRLSRSVGVCAVSGAVAHANALTGVLNAFFDGSPMLLITGITPLDRLGFEDFQDFNPVRMAAPICKYARLIDTPQRIGHSDVSCWVGRFCPDNLKRQTHVADLEFDESSGDFYNMNVIWRTWLISPAFPLYSPKIGSTRRCGTASDEKR